MVCPILTQVLTESATFLQENMVHQIQIAIDADPAVMGARFFPWSLAAGISEGCPQYIVGVHDEVDRVVRRYEVFSANGGSPNQGIYVII